MLIWEKRILFSRPSHNLRSKDSVFATNDCQTWQYTRSNALPKISSGIMDTKDYTLSFNTFLPPCVQKPPSHCASPSVLEGYASMSSFTCWIRIQCHNLPRWNFGRRYTPASAVNTSCSRLCGWCRIFYREARVPHSACTTRLYLCSSARGASSPRATLFPTWSMRVAYCCSSQIRSKTWEPSLYRACFLWKLRF
jgi:hypothetical protein